MGELCLILQGLETLSLRMERHIANAQALAEWLEAREELRAAGAAYVLPDLTGFPTLLREIAVGS